MNLKEIFRNISEPIRPCMEHKELLVSLLLLTFLCRRTKNEKLFKEKI